MEFYKIGGIKSGLVGEQRWFWRELESVELDGN